MALKTMAGLVADGKQVTTLNDSDLVLVGKSPFGSGDDAVIEVGDLKTEVIPPMSGDSYVLATVAGTLTANKQTYFDADGNLNASAYDVGAAGGGGGDVIRTKYIITPSVSSNNLTVAIKYIDGNDPTSTNKLTFRAGNTEYDLTTSASYTKNAATNWHNAGSADLATQDIDYFVYAIGETGASAGLKFGHSRIPHATTMGDFVNTTTSEKYIAGNWTNFNSTDAVTVIGRFRARLSAGAGYTWSIPTAKVINRPIYNTDFLTIVPTVTSTGGTPTTLGKTASYQVNPNSIDYFLGITVTDKGTATGNMNVTLPFTTAGVGAGAGREDGVTGKALSVSVASGATTAGISLADGVTVWVNSYIVDGYVKYRI
jgi:hypothetical protein